MSDEQKTQFGLVDMPIGQPAFQANTPDELTFYTNFTEMQISPEDVILQFGLVNVSNPAESKSIARAYMTPGHAKRLSLLLNKMVEEYERNFGTIATNPVDLFTSEARERLGIPPK